MAQNSLTHRQLQVITLLLEGCSLKLAARKLGIHPSAAGNHVERAKEAFGANSVEQLIKKMYDRGLLVPAKPE